MQKPRNVLLLGAALASLFAGNLAIEKNAMLPRSMSGYSQRISRGRGWKTKHNNTRGKCHSAKRHLWRMVQTTTLKEIAKDGDKAPGTPLAGLGTFKCARCGTVGHNLPWQARR